jgi:hypothetical protein
VVDFELLRPEFDAALGRSDRANGGQIVDATIVEARRPRLTQAEKEVVKGGGVPLRTGRPPAPGRSTATAAGRSSAAGRSPPRPAAQRPRAAAVRR